jgi:RNA polymerase sigma factor (sigma-70 family)
MRSLKPEVLLAHADFLRGLARSLVYDENQADDLVQGTYLAALEGSSRPRRNTRAWLAGITRNVARMTWRGESRRRQREQAVARPDGTVSAADTAARMEEQKRLVGVVAKLDEPYRTAVVLRFLDGLQPREIAAKLDIPVRTVETRLRRALEKLRTRLDETYRGDRRRWMAAFLPLIHPVSATGRGAGIGLASGTVAKSLALAAVVLVLCFAGWRLSANSSPSHIVPERASIPAVPPPPIEPEAPAPVENEEAAEPVDPPDEDEPVREAPPVIPERDPVEPEPAETEPDEEPVREARPPIVDVEDVPDPVPTPPTPRSPFDAPAGFGNTPPGMAHVEGGEFKMGMPQRVFDGTKILREDDEGGREFAAYEVPEHKVELESFWMDRYEVTNAQYLAYLEDAHKGSFKVEGNLNTLAAIAIQLYGPANPDWWQAIYHANWNRINPGKKNAALPDEFPGGMPAPHWAAKELKEGLVLAVYDLPIPAKWRDHGTVPPGLEDHPVCCVTWHHANMYAAWAGKHLPREIEWERAARGPQNFIRTWGGTWKKDAWKKNEDRLNWALLDPKHPARSKDLSVLTTPVGSFPDGMSGYGMFDMLGNVWEWTDDTLHAYPGSKMETQDWWSVAKIIRGGGYGNTKNMLRTTFRTGGNGRDLIFRAGDAMQAVGFRCARWNVPGADRAYMMWHAFKSDVKLPKEKARPIEFNLFGGVGAEAAKYDAQDAKGQKVFVTGKCLSVTILPRARLDAGLLKALSALAKKTRGGMGVTVGLLHTDLALEISKPKPGKKKNDRDPTPEIGASAEPGDYVLNYHDGRLLLLRPKLMELEPVGYLTTRKRQEELGEIVVLEKAAAGTSEVVMGLDEVRVGFPIATRSRGTRAFVFKAVLKTAQKRVLTLDWMSTKNK